MSANTHEHGQHAPARNFPPIGEISVAVLALVIIGGIYVASHLPDRVSLTPAVISTLLATILVLVNVALLSHLEEFAWKVFFQVAKWSLIAYGIIAGMLEYIFIFDKVRGSALLLFSSILLVFAINIPIHFGFSVARHQEP